MDILETASGITLGEMAGWIAAALFILSGFIEVSKIKLNPWSWLARKIGKAINGEVIEKVDRLEKEVLALDKTVHEKTATDARARILRFGDECLHEKRHSKEHFDQILLDITAYEKYCHSHPEYKNNTAVLTIESIKDIYQKCMEEHDFL